MAAPRQRIAAPARTLVALACAAGTALPGHAVITRVTETNNAYALTLQVGTAGAAVDTVAFSITGANAGLTPTAVSGTPAINVWVTPVRPVISSTIAHAVTLQVDSSTAMACQSGGCGTNSIAFSKISWVASNNAGTGDIQSGRFTGAAAQQIASFNSNANTCVGALCGLGIGTWTYQTRKLDATQLQFFYDNDVIYPGGTYRGTVRFTATME
jgi:hypothetical protein